MIDAYAVTRQFESALAAYTGAKYAVAVGSCSVALQLACHYRLLCHWGFRDLPDSRHEILSIEIPSRTYCSVPMAIRLAGGWPVFRDYAWRGAYELKWASAFEDFDPVPSTFAVWDCARRMTSGMYVPGQFQCVSHSSSKILGSEQGGCILHDNDDADPWFRRMRFDGRTEGVATVDDDFRECGLHAIMLPSIAAQLLLKLSFLPKHNEDLPIIEYPDLSKFEVFK